MAEEGGLGAEGQEGALGEEAHGGRGGRGGQGGQGRKGEPGEAGPAYSSWLTRHVMVAYLILFLGVVMSFAVSGVLYGRAIDRIDGTIRANCEAGNERTLIQRDDLLDSRRQIAAADLTAVLGLTAEQAVEYRRLSNESIDRRLERLPYLDCSTGNRIPIP